jgi:hypothetical protein
MKTAGLVTLCCLIIVGAIFLAQPGLLTELLIAVGLAKRWSCSSYSMPRATLKTLATAQADFRENDRDGDKVSQFWRADVAGLYVLAPKGGVAIKLIEGSVATADDRPVTNLGAVGPNSPYFGYWFRAIRHVDEDPKAPDPDRFAFCAFPDTPASGKYIFIMDETNVIYRAEANGRRGIEVFPSHEELRTQWSRSDGP